MRPRNSRKALAELRRICRANGIELQIVPAKGKGSHQTLFFEDRKRNRRVHVVIAGQHEISPGVQRGILSHLGTLGAHVACEAGLVEFAEYVRGILEGYFNS